MSPSELPDLPYQPVTIHVLGREVQVPEGLTLMKAMEYAGFRLVHGVGCRGGFCGACGILYRMPDDYKLRPALACQTTVAEGMHLAAMPFVPTNRARHDLTQVNLGATTTLLASRYPELARCVACNTCTKACPQELEVMDYIQLALRDDWAGVARESFDCIQCGLCALRCPADIAQFQVAQLARRAHALHNVAPSPQLAARVVSIAAGEHRPDLEMLIGMGVDGLRALHAAREIEEEAPG